jgi:hypothetical protein
MTTTSATQNYIRVFTLALLLVFIGSSCSNLLPSTDEETVNQNGQVTQLATILVTREVTQEVTRLVEVPMTVTPATTPSSTTFTPPLSSTISSSPAASSESLEVTILEHSDCMYGPGSGYLYKYSVFTDHPMEAIGRNWDGSWLYIQSIDGWNPCWIQANLVQLTSGKINGLPIVYSRLPYSNQYNSPDASAHRDGSEVTISWKADWMSLDDYRGYLIEAWLCQAGVQVFDPVNYVPPLASNVGSLSITVLDEPGCTLPSSARIYSAQKQGYSIGSNIPWPAAAPGN